MKSLDPELRRRMKRETGGLVCFCCCTGGLNLGRPYLPGILG